MEAEAFFPELKESEDEKMMHQLHSWMKEFGGAEEYTEKVYTWLKSLLEKQGESYTKRDVDNAFVEGMAFAKNELEKQGESELKDNKDEKIRKKIIETFKNLGDGKIPVDINYADIFTWLEKQGELVNSLSKGLDNAHERIDELIQKNNELCIKLEKQGEPNPYSGISLDYNGHTWGMCARDNGVDILLDKQLFKHLEKQDKQKVPVVDFKAEDWYVSKVDGKIYNAKFMESSEKQGEQVEINPSEFDLRLNRLLKQFESLPKEELANSLSFYLNVVQNDGTYVEEKQGEQKPTNKVEPKFKIGDWITNDYCAGKVIELTNDAYLLDTGQGIPFSCEHNVHLWTIQDAKDGDVLAGKIDGDNYILIFKQIKDGWVETYGHYYDAVDRFCVPSQLFCRDYKGTFHPATKEQRDTLFAKMTEAGYEWDAEKKELKKISQRMVSAEAKEALYDKPAWSEEDETGWTNTMIMIKEVASSHYTKDSIKLVIDWLKSLKERYTWKPSEEQIECLYDAINHYQTNGYPASKLNELYEQMSKIYKL